MEHELRLQRHRAQGLRGPGVKYFAKIGVAEFSVDAAEFRVGDKLLITGPTTGVIYVTPDEIHDDVQAVQTARQGTRVAIRVPAKVRPSDKLFRIDSAAG